MRVLLTAVAAVLYTAGWIAGKVWRALTWCATAVLVGFREATSPKPPVMSRQPETGVPVRPAA